MFATPFYPRPSAQTISPPLRSFTVLPRSRYPGIPRPALVTSGLGLHYNNSLHYNYNNNNSYSSGVRPRHHAAAEQLHIREAHQSFAVLGGRPRHGGWRGGGEEDAASVTSGVCGDTSTASSTDQDLHHGLWGQHSSAWPGHQLKLPSLAPTASRA